MSSAAQPLLPLDGAVDVHDRRRVIFDADGEVVTRLDDHSLVALAEPKKAGTPPTGIKTFHGSNYSSGEWDDEHDPTLESRETRTAAFRSLWRGDPLVRSTLDQFTDAIRQARWSLARGQAQELLPSQHVEDDEKARLAREDAAEIARRVTAANLGLPGPREYRMGYAGKSFSFRKVLYEALTVLWAEVAVWEMEWEQRDGPLGKWWVLRGLHFLDPESISDVVIDAEGTFLGVVQEDDGDAGTTEPGTYEKASASGELIKADRLLIHSFDALGANLMATSMVRPMYRSAKRAQTLRKLRIIHAQRTAAPPPYYKEMEGANPENRAKGISTAKALRGGAADLAWIHAPEGVEFGFMDVGTGATDTLGPARAEADDIFSVAGEEHRRLGTAGSGGTQSLGRELIKLFESRLRSVAEGIRETIQEGVVQRIHVFNWDDGKTPMAQLGVKDIVARDSKAIVEGVTSGILQADGDIEQSFREAESLPDLPPEAIAERNSRRNLPDVGPSGAGLSNTLAFYSTLLNEGGMEADEVATKLRPWTGRDTWADEEKLGSTLATRSSDDQGGRPVGPESEEAKNEPDQDKPPEKKEETNPPEDGKDVAAAEHVGPIPDPGSLGEAAALSHAPLQRATWREPTHFESHFVRLQEIDERFDSFVRRFHQSGRVLWDKAVDEALGKLDPAQPERVMRLKQKPWRTFFEASSADLRAFGADMVEEEIRRQVEALEEGDDHASLAEFDTPLGSKDKTKGKRLIKAAVTARITEELEAFISLNLADVLENIVSGVRRAFMTAVREGSDEPKEAAAESMKDLKLAEVDRIGRDIASRSYNGGRAEAVAEAQGDLEATDFEVEEAVRSEVLDGATCEPCRALDGTVVEVGSEDFWRLSPPNQCLGQSFCRAQWVFGVQRSAAA